MANLSTQRRPRFLGLPTSGLGRTTAWVFLAAIVLVLLNALVVQPITESRTGLEAAQHLYNVVVGAGVFGAGIAGLLALVRNRERSWAVILPVAVMIAALALLIVDLTSI